MNLTYNNVKNFTDLLETNINFFKGDMEETYYYFAKWGEGEDQNDHAIVSTEILIELTEKFRIFTVNGQSSYSDETTDQRSYLQFYMEKETFEKIKNKLLKDNRIWTIFIIKKDEEDIFDKLFKYFDEYYQYYEISSIDKETKRIVVTLDCKEPYSIYRREVEARAEHEMTEFATINSILKNLVYCIIINKEFNKGPNVDEILLKYLQE